MTSLAATNTDPRDPQRWPSSVRASTLLLSPEALARWREHLALTGEDELPEPRGYLEVFERADESPARIGLA